LDIAVFRAAREHYDVHTNTTTGVTTVRDLRDSATTPDHDGEDTLTGVEVLRFDDGDVTLGVFATISVVDRSNSGMNGVSLVAAIAENAADDIGVTNAQGEVVFSPLASAEFRILATKPYTAATDGQITAGDALDVLRLAVGQSPSWGPANALDYIAADINQDGQVTATDALEVLRAAVGLDSNVQPRWIFIDSEADLTGITRATTSIEEGVVFDPTVSALSGLSMTGVLLGTMQEYVS